jgi:hypothetical protein
MGEGRLIRSKDASQSLQLRGVLEKFDFLRMWQDAGH